MAKTILIQRHGHAVFDIGGTDFERPLSDRGHRELENLARILKHDPWTPQLVAVSTARRTLESWSKLDSCFDTSNAEVNELSHFYLINLKNLHEFIFSQSDQLSRIMMVAHNPGLSDFVTSLTGAPYALGTAGSVLLRAEVEAWTDVQPGTCELYREFHRTSI